MALAYKYIKGTASALTTGLSMTARVAISSGAGSTAYYSAGFGYSLITICSLAPSTIYTVPSGRIAKVLLHYYSDAYTPVNAVWTTSGTNGYVQQSVSKNFAVDMINSNVGVPPSNSILYNTTRPNSRYNAFNFWNLPGVPAIKIPDMTAAITSISLLSIANLSTSSSVTGYLTNAFADYITAGTRFERSRQASSASLTIVDPVTTMSAGETLKISTITTVPLRLANSLAFDPSAYSLYEASTIVSFSVSSTVSYAFVVVEEAIV